MTVSARRETASSTRNHNDRGFSRGKWFLVGTLAALLVVGEFALIASGSYLSASELVDSLPFFGVLVITLVVGWLLAVKRPRNPLGWMLIAVPGLFGSVVPVSMLADALVERQPGVTAWLYWYSSPITDTWSWLPPVAILLTQIPLFFPTGRLPSPGWRWFWAYTIVAVAISCVVISASPGEVALGIRNPMPPLPTDEPWLVLVVFGGLLATSFVGSVGSLFVRYRRAAPFERAQIRWVLWAVAIAVGVLIVVWLIPGDWPIVNTVGSLTYGLIPIAIGVAVMRYRLYDIDRIISRTVGYAIVTVAVVGTYVLVVLTIGSVLPGLPAVGVALATLAAAAVFLPLVRRVQRFVDRRFDRERYDAEKVVERFGERLRTGADPASTGPDLAAAVEQTLAPASVGLWIVPSSRSAGSR